MSETSSGNPQAINRPLEAMTNKEAALSPEQQQAVDAMAREGQKIESAVLDAREKADGKLKHLQAKELVDAGLKQMGHGVWETVKAELKGGVIGGVAGGIGGGAVLGTLGGIADRTAESALIGATSGAAAGGVFGSLIGLTLGYETAGIGYNRTVAREKQLPPARWYDWLISHGSGAVLNLLTARVIRSPRAGAWTSLIIGQVVNPITAGGLRNVVNGLWHMRKGS